MTEPASATFFLGDSTHSYSLLQQFIWRLKKHRLVRKWLSFVTFEGSGDWGFNMNFEVDTIQPIIDGWWLDQARPWNCVKKCGLYLKARGVSLQSTLVCILPSCPSSDEED